MSDEPSGSTSRSQVGKSFAKATPRERITQVVEGWFLTEPLLFAAWTMHDVLEQPGLATIRVGNGRIEFNPEFIRSLRREELRHVLSFEAMRILLGHPYTRRQSDAELSYEASNLTVQECLRTPLPMPRPRDVFGDPQFDDQYFEYYYRELSERATDSEPPPPNRQPDFDDSGQDDQDSGNEPGGAAGEAAGETTEGEEPSGEDESHQDSAAERDGSDDSAAGESGEQGSNQEASAADRDEDQTQSTPVPETGEASGSGLDAYSDASQVGLENTAGWDEDDLARDEINTALREAAETGGWGTIGGRAKEQLLANLNPKLDYRSVLRTFRQSVLSVRRRLTRMKPSRRYGFAQMGSRYEFTTKLLFAVDVSGSMGSRDLQLGFSVVSRFFRYGVESVDVIWFDEAIRGGPLTLRRARSSFEIVGRGGTDFKPVIDYIDEHPDYDGLIIFTDGYAPVPPKPRNSRTRILWLFKDEVTYEQMHSSLRPLGRAAYLKNSARR